MWIADVIPAIRVLFGRRQPMNENTSPPACRFRPGDRAVVREHNQFRGCSVRVTEVDRSRRIVKILMQVWPGVAPAALELEYEVADDILELEPSEGAEH